MFRESNLGRIFAVVVLGTFLGIGLIGQANHPVDPARKSSHVPLTPAQIADALAVLAEFCGRISVRPNGIPAHFTEAQITNQTELISEVCDPLSPDSVLIPAERI